MVIIETAVFTECVLEMLSDDEYREFQEDLARNPDAGALIPESGGLRKVRVKLPGRGKRGGGRVIYYVRVSESQILMLYIYDKAEAEDLTKAQVKALRKIVEGWK